jgi:predicted nucleotidyltransferase component of viral defense system
MIAEICFTVAWLENKRRELRGVDPSLLERALHAFALLGHLAESDLEFVFKGGTSLLLHVPVIRRLSIDIDILCSTPVLVSGEHAVIKDDDLCGVIVKVSEGLRRGHFLCVI